MSNFPLYNSLNKDIQKKDLSVREKQDFMSKIKNINNIGQELIYALIQFYYIENELDDENITDVIPYKGITSQNEESKSDNCNITWIFTNFPIKLRHILYKFILLHTEKMEEENNRRK